MAHKIKELFKKRPSFQEAAAKVSNNEIKTMFDELSTRIDKVEATLEDLVNKKD